MLVDTARTLFAKRVPARRSCAARGRPTRQLATTLFERHLRDWVALAGGAARRPVRCSSSEAGAAVAPGPVPGHGRAVRCRCCGPPATSWPTPPSPARSTGTVAVAGAAGAWVRQRRRGAHPVVLDAARGRPGRRRCTPGPGRGRGADVGGRWTPRRCETMDLARDASLGRRRAGSVRSGVAGRRRRAGATCVERCRGGRGRRAGGRRPLAASTPRSPTPASGCSSASRSARSRRCSASWSTRPSPTSGPRPRCPTPPWPSTPTTPTATGPCTWPRPRPAWRPGGAPGRPPGARRHRLHVGARPAPPPAPGLRRRRAVRDRRVAPRPPGRPALRRDLTRTSGRIRRCTASGTVRAGPPGTQGTEGGRRWPIGSRRMRCRWATRPPR